MSTKWIPVPQRRIDTWAVGLEARVTKDDNELLARVRCIEQDSMYLSSAFHPEPACVNLADPTVQVSFRIADLPTELGWISVDASYAAALPAAWVLRASSGHFAVEGEVTDAPVEDETVIVLSVSPIGPTVRLDIDKWAFAIRAGQEGMTYPGTLLSIPYTAKPDPSITDASPEETP